MSEEANEELVHRFFAAVNEHDPEAIKPLFAPGFVFHSPRRAPMDADGWGCWFSRFVRGFPDLQVDDEDMVAGGDQVAVRWTARGTHLGMFQSIAPTGREVTMPGISIFQIAGGKIAQNWVVLDELGLLEQLGVILVRGRPFPE